MTYYGYGKKERAWVDFFCPISLVGNARSEKQSNIKVNDCNSGKKKNVLVRITTVNHTAMVVKWLTRESQRNGGQIVDQTRGPETVHTTLVGRSEYRPSLYTTLVGRSEYCPSFYIYGPQVGKNTLKWGKQ